MHSQSNEYGGALHVAASTESGSLRPACRDFADRPSIDVMCNMARRDPGDGQAIIGRAGQLVVGDGSMGPGYPLEEALGGIK